MNIYQKNLKNENHNLFSSSSIIKEDKLHSNQKSKNGNLNSQSQNQSQNQSDGSSWFYPPSPMDDVIVKKQKSHKF